MKIFVDAHTIATKCLHKRNKAQSVKHAMAPEFSAREPPLVRVA